METGFLSIAAADAVYINLIAMVTGDKLDSLIHRIGESMKDVNKFKADPEHLSLAESPSRILSGNEGPGQKSPPTRVRKN